jgi:hypothetical protein
MDLGAKDYLEGAAFALVTLGACGFAGWLLITRRLPWLHGIVHALAVFLAVTGLIVGVHLLPGALGILSRWSVLAVALLVALGVSRVHAVPGAPERAERERLDPLALLGIGIAAVGALGLVIHRSTQAIDSVDALSTHLPAVARWIQEGSFWQLVQYAPDLSNATYPHNGAMLMLAAVLPWDSVFLVRYVDVPFFVAAAFGVYAVARELRAPAGPAALAAAAFTCMAAVNEPALRQGQMDPPMLAWFAIGSLFLVRSARGAPLAETVLAGAGLGLAFGTKWYAVVYVPLLVLVWLVARRGAWREAGVLIGTTALTGGFWLVRNWVEAGNPVHPASIPGLFKAPPDPLREKAGFTVSDYLFDGRIWSEKLIPAWGDNFGILLPLLLIAALVAVIVGRRAVRVVAALALVIALLYTKLPDTAFGLPGDPRLVGANARYLVPGLMAGLVAAAWLGGRWRWPVSVLLLAGIVDGVIRSYGEPGLGDFVWAAVLLAAAAVLVRVRRPVNPVVAATGVLLILVGAGWEARNRDLAEPYREIEPTVKYLQTELRPGARIALGKTWNTAAIAPTLPAFGPRLENHVDYLGTFVDGTLRQWRRREGFVAQVEKGRYDAVVIGTGVPPQPRGEEPQAGWLRELGYTERERTERLVLFAR